MMRRTIASGVSFAVLALSGSALAQGVPTTVDPGQMIDRLDRVRTAPKSDMIIEREGDKVQAIDGSAEKAFTLKQIIIDGSTVYGENALTAVYKDYVGQSVSFADLQTIARNLTAHYRNDGYILSRVVLSPQKISGGVVHMQAQEGYVDAVELGGDIRSDRDLLASYGDKITLDKPLHSDTLERYLLLMDDLPGVNARGTLRASASNPSASTLVVSIEEDQWESSIGADNRGTRFLGQYQLRGTAALNSAFGGYERQTARVLVDAEFDELAYGDFMHEMQVGGEGGRATARIAATRTQPGSRLEPLDIEGTTRLIELGYSQPVIRSRRENLFLRGEFRAQNTDNDLLGFEVFDDHIRHLTLGADYDKADNWRGINQLGLSVTQGLDILGATDDGIGRSRVTANNNFTRMNASVSRIQDITDDTAFVISSAGQYAFDSLLTSEQFSLGGAEFGRAYDSAEILGDSGLAGSLELRHSMASESVKWIDSYQFYGFYDLGTVWLRDPLVGEQSSESLSSTGVGVRFNMIHDLSGDLELSAPLTRTVASEKDKDKRLFFSLTKRF